jgi:hypothetical protein
MKQLRTLLTRAFAAALLLVALSSSLASADTGAPAQYAPQALPEDPGIENIVPAVLPEDPGIN